MTKRKEFPIGTVFGKWTVRSLHHGEKGDTKQYCECECGYKKLIHSMYLRNGATKQCKNCSGIGITTHGLHKHPLYDVRNSMISRCYSEKAISYRLYGARGIGVCDEWRSSFEDFYQWSMVNGYKLGLQLDRKDNDSGYSPENCRWVTRSANMRNTRSNRMLTHDGETRCVTEWAEITGIRRDTIVSRLNNGWSVFKSLTSKKMKRGTVAKDKADER